MTRTNLSSCRIQKKTRGRKLNWPDRTRERSLPLATLLYSVAAGLTGKGCTRGRVSLPPFSLHLSLPNNILPTWLDLSVLSQQYWPSSLLHSVYTTPTHTHRTLYLKSLERKKKGGAGNKLFLGIPTINYFTSRFNSVERSLSSLYLKFKNQLFYFRIYRLFFPVKNNR